MKENINPEDLLVLNQFNENDLGQAIKIIAMKKNGIAISESILTEFGDIVNFLENNILKP